MEGPKWLRTAADSQRLVILKPGRREEGWNGAGQTQKTELGWSGGGRADGGMGRDLD